MNSAILLISCPDKIGIVAKVSNFLFKNNANIINSEQHQDVDANLFLMRVEWDLSGFNVNKNDFKKKFQQIADEFKMDWSLSYSNEPKKILILSSKHEHCLADLLQRNSKKELSGTVDSVISNHNDSKDLVDFYKIPYLWIPIDSKNKQESMNRLREKIEDINPDLIILARYMQILPPEIVYKYPNKIINIHHSFLPAFVGASPYKQAFNRGVKIIGATSHYVTEILDDGPIIEQDVVRTSHHESVRDLIEKGADLERIVLARAVKWHLENRILVYGNKTVVFK